MFVFVLFSTAEVPAFTSPAPVIPVVVPKPAPSPAKHSNAAFGEYAMISLESDQNKKTRWGPDADRLRDIPAHAVIKCQG